MIISMVTYKQWGEWTDWTHSPKGAPTLATSVLIELWKRLNLKLGKGKCLHKHLKTALQSRNYVARLNALDFVTKLTFYVRLNCKKILFEFVSDLAVEKLLEKLAMTDKRKEVKIAAYKFLYAFTKLQIEKKNCVAIAALWERIQNIGRLNSNVSEAINRYDIDKKQFKHQNFDDDFLPDPIAELEHSWLQTAYDQTDCFDADIEKLVRDVQIQACGDYFGIEKMPKRFKNNAKAKEIINLFAYWLDADGRTNKETKKMILKLLIPFANSYDKSVWDHMKSANRIVACLMGKEWKATNRNYLSLVTQTLIEIKIASNSTLQDWAKYIIPSLQSRNNNLKILCLDFLTKLCILCELSTINIDKTSLEEFNKQKRKRLRKISVQIEEFIDNDIKIKQLLKKVITKNKDKAVRDCAAKFICSARKICWNSTLDVLYTEISKNQTAKKSLAVAAKLNKRDTILLQDNIVKIPKLSNRKRANTMNSGVKSQLKLRQVGHNMVRSIRKYNESLPDPIKHLTKTWWLNVSEIKQKDSSLQAMKKRFTAVQTLMKYACGNLDYEIVEDQPRSYFTNNSKITNKKKLPKKLKDNKQAKDILDLFGEFIKTETHIPTRKLILRLLVPFANSFKSSKWVDCIDTMMGNLICKQYAEFVPGFDLLVTNALIAIYVKHKNVKLTGSLKEHLLTALNSNNPKSRMSVLDFLSKLCVFSEIKNVSKVIDDWDICDNNNDKESEKEMEAVKKISIDVEELFSDSKFKQNIKEIVCRDINERVRIHAAKFIYAAKQICWSKKLDKFYKKLSKHRTASISLNIASEFYKLDKESLINNDNNYRVMKKYKQLLRDNGIKHVFENNELILIVNGYCHAIEKLMNKNHKNKNKVDDKNIIFIPNDIIYLCVLYAESSVAILNIAVGQAGASLTRSFYELLLKEYNLDTKGCKINENDKNYIDQVFLKEHDDGRAIARSLIIDTEPGTFDVFKASQVNEIFLPQYMQFGVSGAGNNWAKGYHTNGLNCWNEYIFSNKWNKLRKEIENIDQPQGIQFIHSLGGGTGSGMGTMIMNKFKQLYPHLITTSFSIFPSKIISDVVVEPYNALFSLSNMLEDHVCDCTFVIDNGSLYNIWANTFGNQPRYTDLNFVASQMMSDITSLFRYNDSYGLNLPSFINKMIKYPKLKFLNFSRAPFYDSSGNVLNCDDCQNDSYELVKKLFEKNNRLYSNCNLTDGINLSTLILYRGQNSTSNKYIQTSIKSFCHSLKLKGRTYFDNNDLIYTQIKNQSICKNIDQVAMIANSTSIVNQFEDIISHFDKMYKRKAFVHWYIGEGMEPDEFITSKSIIQDLIDDYEYIKHNL